MQPQTIALLILIFILLFFLLLVSMDFLYPIYWSVKNKKTKPISYKEAEENLKYMAEFVEELKSFLKPIG